MKRILCHTTLVLLGLLTCSSCQHFRPSASELIGTTKEDLIVQLGEPDTIVHSTHAYPSRGLSVIIHDDKVLQYIIKNGSDRQTPLGVGIGDPISKVTERYGKYKTQQEVVKWFAGDEPHVLYHHGEFNKYKLNYPDSKLIFMFDEDKNVESIWFGFPAGNKKPQPKK